MYTSYQPVASWFAVLVLCCYLIGCGGSEMFQRYARNPFGDHEQTNLTTPAQRIAQFEQLASSAGGKSAEEQQRISTDLARQIQNEQDPLIREHILKALSHYRTPVARQVLEAGLRDEEAEVRVVAVEGLAQLGSPEATRAVSQTLQDEADQDVRLAATRALAGSKDPVAVQAVATLLEDSDPALQYRAMQSLQTMTGQNLGADVAAWQQYVRNNTLPGGDASSIAERLGNLRNF